MSSQIESIRHLFGSGAVSGYTFDARDPSTIKRDKNGRFAKSASGGSAAMSNVKAAPKKDVNAQAHAAAKIKMSGATSKPREYSASKAKTPTASVTAQKPKKTVAKKSRPKKSDLIRPHEIARPETSWSSSNASSSQKKAITVYSGGDFYEINGNLRKGLPLSGGHAETVRELDEITNNSSFEGVLYRGIGDAFADEMAAKHLLSEGAIIEERGFLSASRSKDIAKDYCSVYRRGILIEISATKGSKMADISELSKYAGEQEVVGARGSRMRVKSFDEATRILRVELLKPSRHADMQNAALDGVNVAGKKTRSVKSLIFRWKDDDGSGLMGVTSCGVNVVLGRTKKLTTPRNSVSGMANTIRRLFGNGLASDRVLDAPCCLENPDWETDVH